MTPGSEDGCGVSDLQLDVSLATVPGGFQDSRSHWFWLRGLCKVGP